MKKIYRPHVFIPLLISCFFSINLLTAQNNNKQHPLVGTWSFNQTLSFAKMVPEDKNEFDKNGQMKTQILSAYDGRTLFFGEQGEYLQVMADGSSITGNWVLDSDNNVLTITNNLGSSIKQSISKLNASQLSLVLITGGNAKAIIPEQYYTKVKK